MRRSKNGNAIVRHRARGPILLHLQGKPQVIELCPGSALLYAVTPGVQIIIGSMGEIMHRSQLAGFIIDCRTQDLDQAAEFWSRALGFAVMPPKPSEPLYRRLDTGPEGLHVEVQQVEHESRVHLDIESDDIEAEVRRLEKLGARVVGKVQTWTVMEAPTGQRFCVVRQQPEHPGKLANIWNGEQD